MTSIQTNEPARAASGASVEARIAELVASGSVEMSPRDVDQIAEAATLLPTGMRVYVNALPGRLHFSTLRAMEALRDEALDPVPHIAARRLESRQALLEFVKGATHAGVHRILLVGGDQARAAGPYDSALDVLKEGIFADHGIREVGLAGYPEGHPRIAQEVLETALAAKVELAKAQKLDVSIVTQFSFAPARIAEYCAQIARRYPQLPLYVGMAGPTSTSSLLAYAQRCGVSASLRALSGMGLTAVKLVTHSDPMEQLAALARHCEGGSAGNVVGSHFFSFGGFVKTASLINRIISEGSSSPA